MSGFTNVTYIVDDSDSAIEYLCASTHQKVINSYFRDTWTSIASADCEQGWFQYKFNGEMSPMPLRVVVSPDIVCRYQGAHIFPHYEIWPGLHCKLGLRRRTYRIRQWHIHVWSAVRWGAHRCLCYRSPRPVPCFRLPNCRSRFIDADEWAHSHRR